MPYPKSEVPDFDKLTPAELRKLAEDQPGYLSGAALTDWLLAEADRREKESARARAKEWFRKGGGNLPVLSSALVIARQNSAKALPMWIEGSVDLEERTCRATVEDILRHSGHDIAAMADLNSALHYLEDAGMVDLSRWRRPEPDAPRCIGIKHKLKQQRETALGTEEEQS